MEINEKKQEIPPKSQAVHMHSKLSLCLSNSCMLKLAKASKGKLQAAAKKVGNKSPHAFIYYEGKIFWGIFVGFF